MKARWICSVLAVSALAVPAFSQIQIYIGSAPPPIRYEVRPPIPGDGYAWADGYWGVHGNHYVWVPGAWQRPPYPGAYWTHPHYDHYQQGWQVHEGHWDHEDHRDHHDDHHDHHDNGHHDHN